MYEITVKVRVYAASKEDAEDIIMDMLAEENLLLKEMETKEVTE